MMIPNRCHAVSTCAVRSRHQVLPSWRTLSTTVKALGGGGGAFNAARSASLLWLDFCDFESRVLSRFTCKQRQKQKIKRRRQGDRKRQKETERERTGEKERGPG